MFYSDIDAYSIRELNNSQVLEIINNLDIKPLLVLTKENNFTLEEEIISLFKVIGIPNYLKGYKCLLQGILLMIEYNFDISITKVLYPKIGNELHMNASQVEKNIRKAIEISWSNINPELIDKLFGYTISINKDHPTNSHFMITIGKYIINKHKIVD